MFTTVSAQRQLSTDTAELQKSSTHQCFISTKPSRAVEPVSHDYGKIFSIKTLKQPLFGPQTNFCLIFSFHCHLDYCVRGACDSAFAIAHILLSSDDFFSPHMVEEAWKGDMRIFY